MAIVARPITIDAKQSKKFTMKLKSLFATSLVAFLGFTATETEANPYLGYWALTTPGGGAGWLGITQKTGYYDGRILWIGGSVVPTASVFFNDNLDTLYVTRLHRVERKDADGEVILTQEFPELIEARVYGDRLECIRYLPRTDGEGIDRSEFTGKRIPPLPEAPDLDAVKFGEAISLFNGRNLEGWELTDPNAKSGWSVEDGILTNNPVQKPGQPHIYYGNLRTKQEFEDFNLTLGVRVPPGGNSGVYLRGIYEVQVTDSFGKPLDPHHMGAVYSRIRPSVNAEKPAGEWQTLDITLVDRHVTVVLNGTKIIANQPLLGCTGGALWSDQFRPGPIYLQGDHTGVSYRNIELRPVVD